ncbi:MAG: FAD-linked oxidase C-terminal domain-containing protein [Halobacteriota archaeon]|nr:FAD-linked oxidase C-terminal domain-containing protein [Halobacteriota archaeon]
MQVDEIIDSLVTIVGRENVLSGDEIPEEYGRDEALTLKPCLPEVVVKPESAEEVSKILSLANSWKIPVTPRGAGTGLSGGCVPLYSGILLSLERMNKIIEIDEENSVAVIETGVVLADLYKAVEARGLYYPIYPGEVSATIGGNVATNAGGMRAVRYGVTRHFVLGLEAVLPTGEIISTGGKYVKVSTGYDLTQLICGSEGTLAVVTRIILKLLPRPRAKATLLVPFKDVSDAIGTVPIILKSGVIPVTIEFLEKFGLIGMESYTKMKVPIGKEARSKARAYLIIVLEEKSSEAAFKDAELISDICMEHGAIDVFIPSTEKDGRELLELREKAFYATRDAGASDLIDVVVPRGEIPKFLENIREISAKYSTVIAGAGHAGDGNLHMGIMVRDSEKKSKILEDIYRAGRDLGGTISAEHGIGCEKRRYLLKMEDEVKIELMRRIKEAFDPNKILNPGKIF